MNKWSATFISNRPILLKKPFAGQILKKKLLSKLFITFTNIESSLCPKQKKMTLFLSYYYKKFQFSFTTLFFVFCRK